MAGEIKITKKFIAFFFGGIVLAVFLGIVAGQYFNEWRMKRAQEKLLKENPPITLLEGDILPNFTFATLDGKEEGIYQLLQYDKAVLMLMSTSCGFCAKEIEKWKAELATLPEDVQLIGISADSLSKLVSYSQEKQISFPMLCDMAGKFFEQYQVKSFPVLVLVDANKKVVKIMSGYDAKKKVKDYVKMLAMK
jgi:peroxiredoxin